MTHQNKRVGWSVPMEDEEVPWNPTGLLVRKSITEADYIHTTQYNPTTSTSTIDPAKKTEQPPVTKRQRREHKKAESHDPYHFFELEKPQDDGDADIMEEDKDRALKCWHSLPDKEKQRRKSLDSVLSKLQTRNVLNSALHPVWGALSGLIHTKDKNKFADCYAQVMKEADIPLMEVDDDEYYERKDRERRRRHKRKAQKEQKIELPDDVPKRPAGLENGKWVYARLNLSNDESSKYKRNEQETQEDDDVHHSRPALELHLEFYRTSWLDSELATFHKPRVGFHRNAASCLHLPFEDGVPTSSQAILLEHLPALAESSDAHLGSSSGFTQQIESVSGLSALMNDLLIMEYIEEQPPLLANIGMATAIRNYYWPLEGNKDVPPTPKFGREPITRTPQEFTTVFLALKQGELTPMTENNLFKAQLFPHEPDPLNTARTFLLIAREAEVKQRNYKPVQFFIRKMPIVCTVGNQQPQYVVPAPQAHDDKKIERDRLWVYLNRKLQKNEVKVNIGGNIEEVKYTNRLKKRDIEADFKALGNDTIRAVLKPIAEYSKGEIGEGAVYTARSDYTYPSEHDLQAKVRPERICVWEATRSGNSRLNIKFGLGELLKHSAIDFAKQPGAPRHLKYIAKKVLNKKNVQPWIATSAYDKAVKRGETAEEPPLLQMATELFNNRDKLWKLYSHLVSPQKGTKPGDFVKGPEWEGAGNKWHHMLRLMFRKQAAMIRDAEAGTKPSYGDQANARIAQTDQDQDDDDEDDFDKIDQMDFGTTAGSTTQPIKKEPPTVQKQRVAVVLRFIRGRDDPQVEIIKDPELVAEKEKEKELMEQARDDETIAFTGASKKDKRRTVDALRRWKNKSKTEKNTLKQCTKCHGWGHIATNKLCPLYNKTLDDDMDVGEAQVVGDTVKFSKSMLADRDVKHLQRNAGNSKVSFDVAKPGTRPQQPPPTGPDYLNPKYNKHTRRKTPNQAIREILKPIIDSFVSNGYWAAFCGSGSSTKKKKCKDRADLTTIQKGIDDMTLLNIDAIMAQVQIMENNTFQMYTGQSGDDHKLRHMAGLLREELKKKLADVRKEVEQLENTTSLQPSTRKQVVPPSELSKRKRKAQ
eukprot:TRINITY_DN67861_c4_g4_i1.p1 TRINITY_DN67861_c4_g4~~TRINITY_DN67861_c4_g4_i1.p1  ORF type:complete len:1098 (+),score=151.44 TRINITY_DN67861_c4_g4_i1:28-3321(+)